MNEQIVYVLTAEYGSTEDLVSWIIGVYRLKETAEAIQNKLMQQAEKTYMTISYDIHGMKLE